MYEGLRKERRHLQTRKASRNRPPSISFQFNDALSEFLASGCHSPWFYHRHCSPAGCVVILRRVGMGAVRLRVLGGLGVVSGPFQGASSMETQLAEQDSHQSTNKRQAGLCLHCRTGRTVTRSLQPIMSPLQPVTANWSVLRPITGLSGEGPLWHHTITNQNAYRGRFGSLNDWYCTGSQGRVSDGGSSYFSIHVWVWDCTVGPLWSVPLIPSSAFGFIVY